MCNDDYDRNQMVDVSLKTRIISAMFILFARRCTRLAHKKCQYLIYLSPSVFILNEKKVGFNFNKSSSAISKLTGKEQCNFRKQENNDIKKLETSRTIFAWMLLKSSKIIQWIIQSHLRWFNLKSTPSHIWIILSRASEARFARASSWKIS